MKLKRTHNCGELRASHAGETIILNGWVANTRDHGGVKFVDLRDRYGMTQVTLDPDHVGDVDVKSEWVVAVKGEVIARPEGNVNKDRETGEIEIAAREVEILNRSAVPPFEVVDDVQAGEDTRMKYRYVDMRRPVLNQSIVFRSKVCQVIREVFHEESFVEVETPILMKTTPEGARDYIVPSRIRPGQVYALPQSPQLFKQTLMICGLDRYFQICRCMRDEDLRADRQPEFTQLDMEMSFVERDDVFTVIEKTIQRLYRELKGIEVEAPFRRMPYQEAMSRFGIDKPDTRFGLELVDVSEAVAGCGFKVFSGAVDAGGSVRAIRVPGGAAMARKKVDALEKVAREYGAKGLAWFKVNPDGLQGPVAKFLDDATVAAIREVTGAEEGDLCVFVADRNAVVFAALARVRLHLGRQLDLIDDSKVDLLWVIDFPLFEYDDDAQQWHAMHHMFTSPHGELPENADELGAVVGNLYDLVMNGNEMGSGSIRIHDPAVQQRIFDLIGLPRDEAEAKFGWFLRALEYGAPPHGGIALGLDRLVMVMLGHDNLRDVIAFPKNSNAVCPMTESPSEPVGDALEVLGLEYRADVAAPADADAG